MRVSFACPSCDAKGSTDSRNVGRPVRCKRCGADFAIPRPGGVEPDTYALEGPADAGAEWVPQGSEPRAVFVPSRADERRSDERPRRTRWEPEPQSRGRKDADGPGLKWLVRAGVGVAVTIALIALLAPHGTWLAGCILLVLGGLMVPVGYVAGAYGAFQEDLLYGLLYLAIPFYAAYYMVTRWDDLWVWLTCSTVGVGLVLLGTELVRWAGVPV